MERLAWKSVIASALALPLALGASPAHVGPSADARGGLSETRYVALGDSFASGVGAGEYIASSGACSRSPRAYPALWAAAHRPSEFEFVACSGATTAEVQRYQVPLVSRATTLVTLTIGGNDMGFSRGMEACLPSNSSDADCDRALEEAERVLREELPGALRRTYQGIAAAAPQASVVLAGYPRLLETDTGDRPYGTPSRRARINALTDRLDDLVQKTGEKQGFAFADVRGAFAGHGLCAPGTEAWIHPLAPGSRASVHPTAEGQRLGYLPVVSTVVRESAAHRRPGT